MRNNMTEMIQHVAKLHNAGVSMDAIAERRGVSVRTVAGYISRAKTAGLVSGESNSLGRLLRSLPPEVRRWLEAQVPPGSTVTEMIGAIIADAYYEENHVAHPDTGM